MRTPSSTLLRNLLVLAVMLGCLWVSPQVLGQTPDAQFMSGTYTILPNATGTSVTMQLAGVQDEQTGSGATSGSLGFELWYLPSPFSGSGGPVTGNKVAEAYLPIGNCTLSYLNAGEFCSGITVQSNITLPNPGTYYPVLFLVEHASSCSTNNGFCYIDHIALTNLGTGGPTVTVQSSSGGAGGSTGHVVFSGGSAINSLNWQTQQADLTIPAINNASNAESGTIAVALWLQSTPYNGSSLGTGYTAVFYRLPASCTIGNSQLAPGGGCPSFDAGSIPLSPIPAGTYYPVLLLEEYCGASSGSGYCLDDLQTFSTATETVSYPSGVDGIGSPGGGAGGVQFVGTQKANFDFTGGTADLQIGGVNNSTGNTTGTIEIQLWFTTTSYPGSGGFTGNKVASYRLPASCTVGYNQLSPNSGCQGFDTGTISASYPNPGTYYAIAAIEEYSSTNSACSSNGGFCLVSALQLNQTVTVPQPQTTTIVTQPSDGGSTSGGGGGSLDVLVLGGLLIAGAVRAAARLTTHERDTCRKAI